VAEASGDASAPAPVVHADPALTGPLADAGLDDKAAVEATRTEKQKAAEAKAERKETILETLAKNKAKAASEKPIEAKKPEPAAKPDKPAPIEEVAKLNAEVRRLKADLAKFADKKPGESKADLLAAIKKDPAILFTELADESELMVKLAEARQKQLAAMDPRERELAELRDKHKAIEDKLADADRVAAEARQALQDKNVYDATAKLLQEGYKSEETGQQLFDHTPYGYCRAFTEAGEVDAPGLVQQSTTDMIRDLVGLDEKGQPLRAPTEKETATILQICFDKLEARLRKLGQISRAVDAKSPAVKTQKTEVKERPQERRPPTIASAMGRGGHVPVMRAPGTKKDRKAAILTRLSLAKRQESR